MNGYEFIKEVINEWDPMGFISMGFPRDEYDFEIRDVVRLSNGVNSVDELAVGIQNVFLKWFEQKMPIEECYSVALKVWNNEC